MRPGLLLLPVLLTGCPLGDSADTSTSDTAGSGTGCPAVTDATTTAIVTDIDATLTTADSEWVTEIVDPSHDPAMRPDANTLMQGYHDRGYRIFYVTARGSDLGLLDGTSAMDATTGWLDAHDFPYEASDVHLADGLGAFGSAVASYKEGVLTDIAADGETVVWAYGNADTDVEAYQGSGLADDHIFLVGDLAGEYGVVGISNDDAYTNHVARWLPTVACGS